MRAHAIAGRGLMQCSRAARVVAPVIEPLMNREIDKYFNVTHAAHTYVGGVRLMSGSISTVSTSRNLIFLDSPVTASLSGGER